MKKIFILSCIFGVVGVGHAANVIDGNPFYNPRQGRFYNIFTPVEMNSKFDHFVMADEFGYGVSDMFAIHVATSGSYDSSDKPEFGKWAWNDLEFGFDWDLWHQGESVAEIYGEVKQIYNTHHHLETVAYNWTVGARVGRMTEHWTLAGVVQVDYLNDDLPHDAFDAWGMRVGIQGQYILNSHWNLVADLMFNFDLFDDYYDDAEQLVIDFGVNYNFSDTKYIGVWVSKDWVHSFDRAPMVFKIQFGAEF